MRFFASRLRLATPCVELDDLLAMDGARAVPSVADPGDRAECYPARGPLRATLVLFKGGWWSARVSPAYLRPLALALAERGYDVRLLRLGGLEDGMNALVTQARESARSLVARMHPPLILIGHSSGASLSLLAAQALLDAGRPVQVLSIAGVLDPLGFRAYGDAVSAGRVGRALDAGLPTAQLGAPPFVDGRFRIVALYGKRDPLVPPQSAPARVERRIVAAASHFDMLHPGHRSFAAVLGALDELTQSGAKLIAQDRANVLDEIFVDQPHL